MQNNTKRDLHTIKKILLEQWDPIGVGQALAIDDEYDDYASGVYKILSEGTNVKTKLIVYLQEIESEKMGLVPDQDKNTKVVQKLIHSFGS